MNELLLRPLWHSIQSELRAVWIELVHVDSVRLVVEALNDVVQDPAFRAEMDICVEYRSLTNTPSATHLHALATQLRRFGLSRFTGRFAIVAWTPEARDAARQFAKLLRVPPDRLRVFSDDGEAKSWFASRNGPA